MNLEIQLVIKTQSGGERTQMVAELSRSDFSLDTLGLTLAEAKNILEKIQTVMAAEQAAAHIEGERPCKVCGDEHGVKGNHNLVLRTVFGKLKLQSPRWYTCCETGKGRSYSPLAARLSERTTPELLYLETRYSSLMSYGLSVDILGELLPIGRHLNATTVRRHQQRVAARLEGELGEERPWFVSGCQLEWANLPRPDAPLIVGIDGGYVHARDGTDRKAGWFEVIAAKSYSEDQPGKCFAFVHTYDEKPRRRFFEVLSRQGLKANQQVTFMSDGGDTVRQLQLYITPHGEHILDWFHVTMRLTVMLQMLKGAAKVEAVGEAAKRLEVELTRAKWLLWHGNTYRAIATLDETLDFDAKDVAAKADGAKQLPKLVREFRTYIELNASFIPNYGDRYRHGERVSTAFAESTVNQVITRRFVKKQQMRWTKRGAHLLLQTRTRVLNGELWGKFQDWYPGMPKTKAA